MRLKKILDKEVDMSVPATAVIYCIYNTINGKRYIGQTTNYKRRTNAHKSALRCGRNKNPRLQADYNKGHVFEFEILETCQYGARLDREWHYMRAFKTLDCANGYNETSGDGSFSEDTREKIRKNQLSEKNYLKGLTGEKHPMFGRVGEKHHRSKLKDSQRDEICIKYASGRTQKSISEEYSVSIALVSHIVRKWKKNKS